MNSGIELTFENRNATLNLLKTFRFKIMFIMNIIDDLKEENPIDEVINKEMMTFQIDERAYKVFTIKGFLE